MRALAPVRTVAPAVLPVSLAEAKAHLRIDHADEDALVDGLIAVATAELDGVAGILGRALITQTWTQALDGFPGPDLLRLPLAPLQSMAVAYVDRLGAVQVLAPTVYEIGSDWLGPFLSLADGQVWPDTATRVDAVRLTMVVGYGDTGAAVPAPIRQAILITVGDLYAFREQAAVETGRLATAIPSAATVARLIAKYRRQPA